MMPLQKLSYWLMEKNLIQFQSPFSIPALIREVGNSTTATHAYHNKKAEDEGLVEGNFSQYRVELQAKFHLIL